eukprot:9468431-Pyramimonas_sp.AAC.1
MCQVPLSAHTVGTLRVGRGRRNRAKEQGQEQEQVRPMSIYGRLRHSRAHARCSCVIAPDRCQATVVGTISSSNSTA